MMGDHEMAIKNAIKIMANAMKIKITNNRR